MEINLRKEMVKWLKKRGHWGILRVLQTSHLSGEADKETGQSYLQPKGTAPPRNYVDHLVKMDRRKVVPDLNQVTSIGEFPLGVDYFYLEYTNPIKEGDLILEVELNQNGLPITPFKVRAAYKVVDPEDMRDQNGRVEFYQCRVEQLSVRI